MDFKKIIPHTALGDLIECYIYSRFDFAKHQNISTENNFLPTHRQLMLIDLDDVVYLRKADEKVFLKREAMVLPGTHLKNVIVKFSGAYHRSICVCFQPGGLHRLLGLPMHEMVNKDYSGSELLGKAPEELCERLKNSTNEANLWLILDQYFLSLQTRLKPINKVDILIREIDKNPQVSTSIDEISLRTNTSVRQLERLFKQRLGVGPKVYFRLVRFSNAHSLKEHCPKMPWTKIAYEAGYYDQMHLIKDFKEFTGFTPTAVIKDAQSTLQFQILDY